LLLNGYDVIAKYFYKLDNRIKLHYRPDRTRPGRTRPAGATST